MRAKIERYKSCVRCIYDESVWSRWMVDGRPLQMVFHQCRTRVPYISLRHYGMKDSLLAIEALMRWEI